MKIFGSCIFCALMFLQMVSCGNVNTENYDLVYDIIEGNEVCKEYEDDVKIFDNEQIDNDVICNRIGTVIVEIVDGTVVDNNGNGLLDNGGTVSYGGIDGMEIGDRMRTIIVYNPETNYCDDVIELRHICID